MKTKILLSVFSILSFLGTYAQQHLPESKSLIGLWQHIVVAENVQGETSKKKSDIFKVINSDGTFYHFSVLSPEDNTISKIDLSIYMYGTYGITSDSTFTEHVITNNAVLGFNNSVSELRYKFASGSDNNLVYIMWKNTTNDQWIPEMWERVTMPQERRTTEKRLL